MKTSLAAIFFLLTALTICLTGCTPEDSNSKSADQKDKIVEAAIPTWHKNIEGIIHNNCMPCHHQGGAGPFPLVSYKDVAKRKKMVGMMTMSKIMPPWPADRKFSHFLGERGLSDKQIMMIQKWIEEDAPLGDENIVRALPNFDRGFMNRQPDLVLKFPIHAISDKGKDEFLLMKVPFELPNDTFVQAIEFLPGRKKIVHHMNANLINYLPGKKTNQFGGEKVIPTDLTANGLAVQTRMDNLNDDGSWPALTHMVCNYLPGASIVAYPEGIGGFKMAAKGAFFINDMHYGPSSEPAMDSSEFRIWFAKTPPKRKTSEFILGTHAKVGSTISPPLIVPPNKITDYTLQYTVPEDISILTINPHMHLLGKSFKAFAIDPVGDTIKLVSIPEWDFKWQYFYTFEKMLHVPKGSTIYVEAEMDNTKDNPNNPNDPPLEVREPGNNQSMRTVDEMLQFIVTWLPYQQGDEGVSLKIPIVY
ncbi:MAG: hypothetical protein ACI959_001903 [Limisphaerales bacterium]|jgi:hypothetical protein